MAERALSEEAVVAGLQDIRLPEDAPGGVIAEMLAGAGLGLSLALLVGLALRTFAPVRGPAAEAAPVSGETARRRALLLELRERRPEVYARLRRDLYRPGGLPDVAALETELARDA
ncbi:hypothetical protein OCH239_03985 [Roseivivax halodurans JCM 10272]|uniref:Uncharacterized protein n=1 Tax=Roseivivax halodurans JCM 10272 TaxID=1449350 RepID=X7EGK1_9RHOB|nr:hypothetical protein [Roseivivax halodurans]ETX14238.1 hypothetical protein OCH239_03985 [Roseivivax halodurans JCM 10272]